MPVFTKMASQLLILADYSSSEADEIVESAKRFDAKIAPNVKSAEESADYSKMYNPQKFAYFSESSSHIDFMNLADALFGHAPGKKEATPQKKAAFYLAEGIFGQTIGDYYAKKYFGPKAKADVEHMVKNMINVYKNRLSNNTWLGKETREKAILKLDKLALQVGYPGNRQRNQNGHKH